MNGPGAVLPDRPVATAGEGAASLADWGEGGRRDQALAETVLRVPQLHARSVLAGGCCPVSVEAVLEPELERLAGITSARVDWRADEVRLSHEPDADLGAVFELLVDMGYPAEMWTTRQPGIHDGNHAAGRVVLE